MRGITGHPVVDIGSETQQGAAFVVFLAHLDRKKRRVIDADADLFHRRHEKVLAVLALEDRGKKPNQRRPADWRAHVKPRTIACDSHVDVAAERRIPQMHRRQRLSGKRSVGRFPRSGGQAFKIGCGLPLLRHCLP